MKNIKNILTAVAIFALAALLLIYPAEAAGGVREGLMLCVKVIIPTLFPYMALAGFLALSGVGGILSWPLLPITRGILKLPAEAGGALLMSFIGGYPAGVKTIASLAGEKRITAEQASRMLCCCVNAGPGFLVSAVGGAIYGNVQIGWMLFFAQVISSVAVGAIVSKNTPAPYAERKQRDIPLTAAFVEAVTSAASAMLSACAFIVFFSAIGSLMALPFGSDDSSLLYLFLSGALEVTRGCAESIRLSGPAGLCLAAFFVGFGSLSVIGQVSAIAYSADIELRPYLTTRPLAGLLAALIAYPLYYLSEPVISVMCSEIPPLPAFSEGGVVGSFCLVTAAVMLLLSCRLSPRESAKQAGNVN